MGNWSADKTEVLKRLVAEGKTDTKIADQLSDKGCTFTDASVRSKRRRLGLVKPTPTKNPADKVQAIRKRVERKEQTQTEDYLTQELMAKEKELEAALQIKETPQSYTIPLLPSPSISAVPIAVYSDWHAEEIVKGSGINYLNSFNLKIAEERIIRCFNNTARLVDLSSANTKTDTMVLALLGDFISGNIHDELLENTSLRPIEAIMWVQERLIAGIRLLLERLPHKLIIVCHSGNHPRITKQIHTSSEAGNSLEYMMYHNMRQILGEDRITWIIAEGYHTYLSLFGKTVRFHHGHAIRYSGGIGGIFIPAYKAISQWDKAKHADLDVFGHFHQLKNGGNFICNGSLIGYNAYGVKIKADYEKPRQKFFMYSSTGEVIAEYPIFLD